MTGTRGQSGRDHGDYGIAQVTCPRQSRQPGLQSCSHRGSSRVQCGGNEAPLSPPPPQGQLFPRDYLLRGPQGLRASTLSPSQLPAIRGLVTFTDNKPWDKVSLEKETQSKPENLPGLTEILEPQLSMESWSLLASQWALPGSGQSTGVRELGYHAVCTSVAPPPTSPKSPLITPKVK